MHGEKSSQSGHGGEFGRALEYIVPRKYQPSSGEKTSLILLLRCKSTEKVGKAYLTISVSSAQSVWFVSVIRPVLGNIYIGIPTLAAFFHMISLMISMMYISISLY